jgi:hypothetical protein
LADIKIVTRELYDSNTHTFFNWTGNFIEESRAFIDRYLGRKEYNGVHEKAKFEENVEGETSGATSGGLFES